MDVVDEPGLIQPDGPVRIHPRPADHIDGLAHLRTDADLHQGDEQQDPGDPQQLFARAWVDFDVEMVDHGPVHRIDEGDEDDHGRNHMYGDDAGGEAAAHHHTAEPALEEHQYKGGEGGNEHLRTAFAVPERLQEGGRDEKSDEHADEPVHVLGPSFEHVELAGVEAGWKAFGGGGRNPQAEAPGPVGAAQTGPGSANKSAHKDEEDGGGHGSQRGFLKSVELHGDVKYFR